MQYRTIRRGPQHRYPSQRLTNGTSEQCCASSILRTQVDCKIKGRVGRVGRCFSRSDRALPVFFYPPGHSSPVDGWRYLRELLRNIVQPRLNFCVSGNCLSSSIAHKGYPANPKLIPLSKRLNPVSAAVVAGTQSSASRKARAVQLSSLDLPSETSMEP